MDNIEETEIKKEFQLERVIFFSDAVFAIIITIIVLDIKLPEMARLGSEAETKSTFMQIVPKLVAYGISFFVIGSFWMRHLRIFSFLKDYNMRLVAINLLFLFSVSLFPFALSFWFSSSHVTHYTWGLYTYFGIISFTFFTQTLLMGYLIRNKEILCIPAGDMDEVLKWKIRRLHYFFFPILIVLMVCAGYFSLSPNIVVVAIIAFAILVRKLKKTYYPHSRSNGRITISSLFNRGKIAKHRITKVAEVRQAQ